MLCEFTGSFLRMDYTMGCSVEQIPTAPKGFLFGALMSSLRMNSRKKGFET